MGLGHFLDKKLGIRFDSHTLGNLTKNVAPVAGVAAGGPLGLAIAGGLGAAGEAGRGGNLASAAKAGLSSAGQAGIGMAAKGGLAKLAGRGAQTAVDQSADVLGAPNALNVPNSVLPEALEAANPLPGAAMAHIGDTGATSALSSGLSKAPAAQGLLGRAGDAAGGVFDFAKEHPNASAGALSAVGNLASAGSENRVRNAQAQLLEKQLGETEYDFQRRKARDAELDPAFAGLGSALGSSLRGGNVAPNPYSRGV